MLVKYAVVFGNIGIRSERRNFTESISDTHAHDETLVAGSDFNLFLPPKTNFCFATFVLRVQVLWCSQAPKTERADTLFNGLAGVGPIRVNAGPATKEAL